MFAQVAAITFESNQYFIKKKHLEELISEYLENVPPHGGEQDGELVLKAIIEQHGIFTERARNDYSFSHLTFQEYFTAKYIVDNARKGILKRLVDHCSEKRWREIFLLMSSLLDDASELIHTFRKAVDEFISKDAKVIKVLARAASKSDLCNTDRLDYREAYLRIGFYGVKFVNHELSSDLGIARSSAFKESPPTNPQNPEIKLDFILYYQLRSETDPDALARYKTKAAAIATELGLTSLAKDLNNLNHPTKKAFADEYSQFFDGLRAIMISHRDIGQEVNLSADEILRLVAYLNSNKLLKDCLELATMSPKTKSEILDSLFLPPA